MHRDIKPNNIMIRGRSGLEPVIADFGLSALVEAEHYIYHRCGTPGYIAPEVFKCNKGDKLTTACDIFSAGCILHNLLLKRPLF
jgi:serine/threonine protein kinase